MQLKVKRNYVQIFEIVPDERVEEKVETVERRLLLESSHPYSHSQTVIIVDTENEDIIAKRYGLRILRDLRGIQLCLSKYSFSADLKVSNNLLFPLGFCRILVVRRNHVKRAFV